MKKKNNKMLKFLEALRVIFITLGISLSVVYFFSNLLLSLVFLFIGLGLAVLTTFFLRKLNPDHSQQKSRREKIFLGITVLVPVLVLFLFEFVLFLVGFGDTYPLFVDTPKLPEYRQINVGVVKKFVPEKSQASFLEADTVFFKKKKQPNTFRVVVQGGSTAAGFPYGRFASIAGMLHQRLKWTFPERDIEVITTAVTAINTYTLLDFADDIIKEEPDAVVIYTGHNEYLGILGVGSTYSIAPSYALTRAYLGLMDTRTFQLLNLIITGLQSKMQSSADASSGSRSLMYILAKEKAIPYGSAMYDAGINQFRNNLQALVKKYRDAGITVLLGNLIANERDQRPFIAKCANEVVCGKWKENYSLGIQALVKNDLQTASRYLNKALEIDSMNAETYYALAFMNEVAGKFSRAKELYIKAKNYDQLRFRAPEEFNQVIETIAKQDGVFLADVKKTFYEESVNGIIDNLLMHEHVHPNLRGYFLLADAFYTAMKDNNMIGPWDNYMPKEVAWPDIPILEPDRLFGEYKIKQLLADYPFQDKKTDPGIPEPSNLVEALAYGRYTEKLPWMQSMTQLLEHYQRTNNSELYAKASEIYADALPFSVMAQRNAGDSFYKISSFGRAMYYYNRAHAQEPKNTSILLDMAKLEYEMNNNDGARKILELILSINPGHGEATQFIKKIK